MKKIFLFLKLLLSVYLYYLSVYEVCFLFYITNSVPESVLFITNISNIIVAHIRTSKFNKIHEFSFSDSRKDKKKIIIKIR